MPQQQQIQQNAVIQGTPTRTNENRNSKISITSFLAKETLVNDDE
jgi:hypothetical protein